MGTAEYQVAELFFCKSQKLDAEKRGGIMSEPPELRVDSDAPIKPWTWNKGITIIDVSSGVSS